MQHFNGVVWSTPLGLPRGCGICLHQHWTSGIRRGVWSDIIYEGCGCDRSFERLLCFTRMDHKWWHQFFIFLYIYIAWHIFGEHVDSLFVQLAKLHPWAISNLNKQMTKVLASQWMRHRWREVGAHPSGNPIEIRCMSCSMLIVNCMCSVTNTYCKPNIICHFLEVFLGIV